MCCFGIKNNYKSTVLLFFSDEILLTSGGPGGQTSGQTITISVFLSTNDVTSVGAISHNASSAQAQLLIGSTSVSGKTKWDMLDSLVKRTFKVSVCLRCYDMLISQYKINSKAVDMNIYWIVL